MMHKNISLDFGTIFLVHSRRSNITSKIIKNRKMYKNKNTPLYEYVTKF